MDRTELRRHLHSQFQEPVFKEALAVIDGLLDKILTTAELIYKVQDASIDAGDKCPDTDPYCVLLWCLELSRFVTYQEWLDEIDVYKQE